jgi:sulfur-oxidizing protein SoxX
VNRKIVSGRLSAFVSTAVLASAIAVSGIAGAEEAVAPGDVVIENLEISKPLTATAGDPAEGKNVFSNRKLGNCLACHANSDMADQLFHGEVGPSLDGAGTRWKPAQLRTIVVNAKAVFSDETVMPGFYSLDVGENVRKDLIGKTILSAQQVEDLVAYLETLK